MVSDNTNQRNILQLRRISDDKGLFQEFLFTANVMVPILICHAMFRLLGIKPEVVNY